MTDSNSNSVTAHDWEYKEKDWPDIGRIRFPQYRVEEQVGKSAHSQIYRISYKKTVGDLLFKPDTQLILKLVIAPVEGWTRAKIQEWEGQYDRLKALLAENPVESLVRLHDFGMETNFARKRVLAGFVYELVEQAMPLSLAMKVEQGGQGLFCKPMPPEVIRVLAPKLAEALAPMHQKGMAHGALKPSNILIGSGGAVRLADWDPLGFLAKAMQRGKGLEDPPGLLWTAPENLANDNKPGPASDVWSLGVLLAMLITGSHPFPGPPSKVVGLLAQGGKIDPPMLVGLPPLLAGLLESCLKINPKERPENAGAFLEALKPALPDLEDAANEPEPGKPALNREQKGGKPVEQNRTGNGGNPVASQLEAKEEEEEEEEEREEEEEAPRQTQEDAAQEKEALWGQPDFSPEKPQEDEALKRPLPKEGDKPLSSYQAGGQHLPGLKNGFWEHSQLPGLLNPVDPAKNYSVITLTIDRKSLPVSRGEEKGGKSYAVKLTSDRDDRLAENSSKALRFTFFPKPFLVGAGPVPLEIGKKKDEYEAILKIRMENKSAAIVESARVLIGNRDNPVKEASVSGPALVKGVGGLLEIKIALDAQGLESLQKNQGVLPIEAQLKVKNRNQPLTVDKLSGGLPWLLEVEFVPDLQITEYPRLTRQEREKKKTLHQHPYEKMPKTRRSFVLENRGGGRLFFNRKDISFLPLESSREQEQLVKNAIELAPDQDSYELGPGESREIGYFVDPNLIPLSDAPPYAGALDFFVAISFKGQTSRGRTLAQKSTGHRIALICKRLKQGRLLAVDFGTTSSLACAYTDDYDDIHRKKFVVEDTKDPILPTIIGYFHEDYDLEIGTEPKFRYREGAPNHFASFKRHLGKDNHKAHKIERTGRQKSENYTPERITLDYLKRLKELIGERSGYYFTKCVFTHPSLFSLHRKKVFRQILKDAGFLPPFLLDEASAGAMEFIRSNKSGLTHYRLLVFDFGGGTTDITFLEVDASNPDLEKLKILDVGGDPDFGGDDVTQAIMDIVIDKLDSEGIIIPLFDKESLVNFPVSLDELEKIRGSNSQRLQSACELVKMSIFEKGFDEGRITPLSLNGIVAYNTDQKNLETLRKQIDFFSGEVKELHKQDGVSRGLVEKAFLPQLLALAEKVVDMTHRHDRKDAPPTLVLLSGRSSNIPLVREIFEKCRQGERPHWDEGKKKIVFGPAGEGENDYPRLLCQSVELSKKPKSIVALGAAYYGFIRGYSIESLNGMGLKTPFRIGIRNLIRPDRFEELINAGSFFVESPLQHNSTNDPAKQYAWAETGFTFSFIPAGGGLENKIEIIELYSSSGNALHGSHRNYETLPRFDVRKPAGIAGVLHGTLRVDVTSDFGVKVHVRFNNSSDWIEAFPADGA
ncbi:MAG: Hsp70 family protein [Desulfatibacillaceae bacterium]|nr:Hsp70 family protein [Desulfatibacillaceae bacterium]